MRLRLFSVDVFWLTACCIVVLSTVSPFHPELPKPCIGGCIDQPPATLVKFGSSKVKMPFFIFISPEALTLSSDCLVPKGGVQESLLISSTPVACSMSQSKSAGLETGLLISGTHCYDFNSERMEKSWQLCRSHLLTLRSSGASSAVLLGQLLAGQWQWWEVLQAGLCDRTPEVLQEADTG